MTYTLSDLAAMMSKPYTDGDGWQLGGYISEAAWESAVDHDSPPPPQKCPHCNRDWHTAPLTRRVANMVRNHRFDPTYKAAEDDSPVECVGSDTCGPNRPVMASNMYNVDFKFELTSTFAKLTESMGTFQWPTYSFTTNPSAPWVTFYDEAYQPITPPCPPDLEVDVKFGPEHWPIERAKAPFSVRHFVSKVHADEWREPIPAPASPGLDVSTLVEQFNKKHNWNGVDK